MKKLSIVLNKMILTYNNLPQRPNADRKTVRVIRHHARGGDVTLLLAEITTTTTQWLTEITKKKNARLVKL